MPKKESSSRNKYTSNYDGVKIETSVDAKSSEWIFEE